MLIRKCDACGQSDGHVLLKDEIYVYYLNDDKHTWTYNLAVCDNCGLVYIDPKPSWDLLQTFYASAYACYNSSSDLPETEADSPKWHLASWRYPAPNLSGSSTGVKQFFAVASEWLSGKIISYSLAVPFSLPKDAHIFDLGYGSGSWLLGMSQLGYRNLYGYDIDANKDNVQRLNDSGIHITDGMFLQNKYPENFFDCIRLEHVFEHLLDPFEIMKKCYKMLKRGGILVMTFPCSQSISFRLSVRHYAHRDSPRHLYLHTPTSTRLLLEPVGFRGLTLKAYPVALVFGATLNNCIRTSRVQAPPRSFSILAPFYALVSYALKSGENITLMATK